MSKCTLPFDGQLGFQPNGEKLEKTTLDIKAENLFKTLLAFCFIYNQDIMLTSLLINGNRLTAGTDGEVKENFLLMKKLFEASYLCGNGSIVDRNQPAKTPIRIVNTPNNSFVVSAGRIFKDVIVEPDGRVSLIVYADSSKRPDFTELFLIDYLKQIRSILAESKHGKNPNAVFTVESRGTLISRKADFKLTDVEELIDVLEGKITDNTKPNDPIVTERNYVMQRTLLELKDDMPHMKRVECCDLLLGEFRGTLASDKFMKTLNSDAYYAVLGEVFGESLLYRIEEFIETVDRLSCFYEPIELVKYKLLS